MTFGDVSRRTASYVFLMLVYLFLLGPMIMVIIASFNSAPAFPRPFESFSIKWYETLFDKKEFVNSMWVSIRVGGAASAIALALGVPASIVLVRGKFRGRAY